MFGWRKRIGYIGPTVMEVVPYEFYRFAPDGVGLVGVTCNIDDWSQDYFDQALAQVTTAAAYLGSRGVDFILHGGGPLVVARGKGFEEIIVKDIEAAGKVPATTGVRAAMDGAAPFRRPPRRDRLALSGAAQQRDGGLSRRARLRDRSRRRHGCAVQEAAERAARRHPRISPPTCWRAPAAATRCTCPARNGRRRRWSTRWKANAACRRSPIRTPASSSAFKTLGIKDAIRGHGRLLASLAETT